MKSFVSGQVHTHTHAKIVDHSHNTSAAIDSLSWPVTTYQRIIVSLWGVFTFVLYRSLRTPESTHLINFRLAGLIKNWNHFRLHGEKSTQIAAYLSVGTRFNLAFPILLTGNVGVAVILIRARKEKHGSQKKKRKKTNTPKGKFANSLRESRDLWKLGDGKGSMASADGNSNRLEKEFESWQLWLITGSVSFFLIKINGVRFWDFIEFMNHEYPINWNWDTKTNHQNYVYEK